MNSAARSDRMTERGRSERQGVIPRPAATVRRVNDPSQLRGPDYSGGALNNLVAELEWRLTGGAPSPRLHDAVAAGIPSAPTYILFLIDGLGAHQLHHPAAETLADFHRSTIHAPFPTTTTVSLACVATGLSPARHGFLGHFILLADHPYPVNGLRWIDSTGRKVPYYAKEAIPAPNLWERLGKAGIEAITIQAAAFAHTPMTGALYRGCRFEGVTNTHELVRATLELSRIPDRLIFVYYNLVDVAAHMHGPSSRQYANALADVSYAWEQIAARRPSNAAMIGTSDHGVVPIAGSGKYRLKSRRTPGLTMYGDPRSLYVKGPREQIEELKARVPATWYSLEVLERLWGSGIGPGSSGQPDLVRKPDGVLMADPGWVLVPGHMDDRLVGYHGGLDPGEMEIPILVSG